MDERNPGNLVPPTSERVIGVVGGVASGKSAVATTLEELGAWRVDADQLGHNALRDPVVKHALTDRWGAEILDAQGHIDRRAVAQRVFAAGAEAELRFLEQQTHPHITAAVRRQIAALPRHAWLVLDAALLLEAGWHAFCQTIIFVDTPLAARQARALARGWDAQELRRRESKQWPLDRKRALATHVLPNDGDLEHLRGWVRQFWQEIQAAAP